MNATADEDELNLILICKLVGKKGRWAIVTNPLYQAPHTEYFAAKILKNFAVEYVEFCNSGVIYRVVRSEVLSTYIKAEAIAESP